MTIDIHGCLYVADVRLAAQRFEDSTMGPSHDTHILTKSTFLRGLRCGKSLMLDALRGELRDPLDADARMRMRQGQEVGQVARRRYPGGKVGRIPGQIQASLQRTRDLIEGGVDVIYEAAFQSGGVFILVDILVRGQSGWRLIEVKSTTRMEDEHLWDVAVQAFVLRGAGLRLEDASLLHVNSDYAREGELDFDALFTEVSLLKEVLELEGEVERSVEESRRLFELDEVPQREIGTHCNDPRVCDFREHCWQHLPTPSVFDVYYIGKKAFELYEEGITRIEEIPDGFPVGKRSLFHIRAHKAGETIIERERIQAFIESLAYPLSYLDFETFALPIPPWDGLRPYNHVPFQYSLHIQREPGGEVVHSGFLAEPGEDPRQAFLDSLLPATEGAGSIVVYYKSFEKGVLNALGDQFPAYRTAMDQRIERLVDLRDPFGKQWFYLPAMGGSTSLKAVLPALAPDLSYGALGIQNGTEAMAVYLEHSEQADPEAYAVQRDDLWEYCKLDTLAMVRILDVLRAQL
ncbi:MAG TPA: DUF2779 domain-containing protein [Anaerolineae bacterium]|nr:DUF2779 domain-containing protein [Anaerolineae bacterium]